MPRTYKVYGGGLGFGFASGGVAHATMHDEISPFLRMVQKHSKAHMARAARHIAFNLKNILQDGIRRGHVDGRVIPARKGMSASFREKIKRRINDSRMPGGDKAKAIKAFLSTSRLRLKTLAGAIKYEKLKGDEGVLFGFASPTSSYWASAVQKGARGAPYGQMFQKSQPITAKQRRFFFALGIKTKKTKTEQPEANVFAPFIRGRSRYIAKTFHDRLAHLVAKDAEKARAKAAAAA